MMSRENGGTQVKVMEVEFDECIFKFVTLLRRPIYIETSKGYNTIRTMI